MALTPISQIMAKVRQGQADGLNDAAREVAKVADRNAPKDTSTLVDSREIHPASAGELRAAITYGEGLEDPRAVINHEKTDIHHDTGGPKYLERALASELPKVRKAIASKIERRLG